MNEKLKELLEEGRYGEDLSESYQSGYNRMIEKVISFIAEEIIGENEEDTEYEEGWNSDESIRNNLREDQRKKLLRA